MVGGAYFRALKCHVCRQRKVKCGGERPSCLRCLHSGLTCTGYQRALDFRIISSNEPIFSKSLNVTSTIGCNLGSIQSSDSRLAHQRGYATLGLDSSYISIAPASQYQKAFLGLLQELYLPEPVILFASRNDNQVLVPAICSTWLSAACGFVSNTDTNSLSSVLLAIALAVVAADSNSEDVSSEDLMHNSIRLYSRSLLSMRNRIAATVEVSRQDWELLNLACFGCFSYELIVNRSYFNARQHLNGIGAMFQKLGPDLLESDLLQDLYFEYRVKDITFQMIQPRSTLMSRQAWIHPQWKTRHPKASQPLQKLLDKAYLFLPVYNLFLPVYNNFALLSNNAQISKSVNTDMIGQLTQLLERAKSIQSDIDKSHGFFQKQYERDYDQEKAIPELQIFQTTFAQWTNVSADPSELHLGKVFPTAHTFADFPIATSFIFHKAIQICITGFLEDMTHQLLSLTHEPIKNPKRYTEQLNSKLMQLASHICQSAEYFLHPSKGILGAMVYLFPLAVAKRAFICISTDDTFLSSEAVRKLNWCHMIEGRLKDFRLSPYSLG
ncbi:hypothetical protein F5884DRAFT_120189 [Xylogone sp. PMI_703]|nr:hypothetical protein F5884DRAFT_120189 [Xylogone sp. PMI_703]